MQTSRLDGRAPITGSDVKSVVHSNFLRRAAWSVTVKPSHTWRKERSADAVLQVQRGPTAPPPDGARRSPYLRARVRPVPDDMAPVLVRGEGARVLDVDGNWFVEYGMGLRSVTLGHGYHPVVEAVCRVPTKVSASRGRPGWSSSRRTVPRAGAGRRHGQVRQERLGRHDGCATAGPAATGRDLVAVCQDQPFFSVDDWFIGTTAHGRRHPAGSS